MGGISHLRHGLRLDCYEEAEVHAFRRLLLVLLIKDWQANPGFVLVLPYGSPVSVDSEEVRLVSPLLWLNNAEGGQYSHQVGLFAANSEERDSDGSFRCSNHQFLLSSDTRNAKAGSVNSFYRPRQVPAILAAAAGRSGGGTTALTFWRLPLTVGFVNYFPIIFLRAAISSSVEQVFVIEQVFGWLRGRTSVRLGVRRTSVRVGENLIEQVFVFRGRKKYPK